MGKTGNGGVHTARSAVGTATRSRSRAAAVGRYGEWLVVLNRQPEGRIASAAPPLAPALGRGMVGVMDGQCVCARPAVTTPTACNRPLMSTTWIRCVVITRQRSQSDGSRFNINPYTHRVTFGGHRSWIRNASSPLGGRPPTLVIAGWASQRIRTS